MTLEQAILLVILLLLAVLVALVLGLQSRHQKSEGAMGRVDARLDEQGKRSDSLAAQLSGQSRTTEEVVRRLDQDLRQQHSAAQQTLLGQLAEASQRQQKGIHDLQENLLERFGVLREGLEQRHSEAQKVLQDTFRGAVESLQHQVSEHLSRNTTELGKRMEALAESTDRRLLEISGQVDKRLSEGFEKTTETFADVVKRLALIDQAQQRITELSTSVVSLQQVLADRTSRGTFGEVQLQALVRNVLPESSYKMQHTLSSGKVVDCMLFLPDPTGNVPIDSKFPLENYRRKTDPALSDEERKAAERAFSKDVQTHIHDVAAKYIVPGETAGGVVMFIPAEAVFADIHAHHYALVELAQRTRVWLTSPTTLMAILTTASAVITDAATREQVGIIREHLGKLGEDFRRFQTRMDNLAQHIDQAHRDVEQVHTSARKITSRFGKIQRLDLSDGDAPALPAGAAEDAAGAVEVRPEE